MFFFDFFFCNLCNFFFSPGPFIYFIVLLLFFSAFIYSCRISPINNYGLPVRVTFSPSIYGEFIISPSYVFTVSNDGNKRKPDQIFTIKSSRELTDKELKRLVRISAVHTSLGTPILSNGKKVIFLNAVPGKTGGSKSEEVRFEAKGKCIANIVVLV